MRHRSVTLTVAPPLCHLRLFMPVPLPAMSPACKVVALPENDGQNTHTHTRGRASHSSFGNTRTTNWWDPSPDRKTKGYFFCVPLRRWNGSGKCPFWRTYCAG